MNFAQNMLQKVSMAVAAAVELPLREGLSIRKNQTPVIFCAQRQAELYTGWFFDWSALKMTKYEEKLKYLNWSATVPPEKF